MKYHPAAYNIIRRLGENENMKTCKNCRSIWADEYEGQCAECGAPMAGVQANGGDDMQRRFARQLALGRAEAGMEQVFRNGGHANVRVDENVKAAALAMLTPKTGAFTDE